MRARALVIVALLGACSEKQVEHAGVGTWSFTTSKLAHAKRAGRCQPTDLADGRKAMWCFGFQPYKIAGKIAEIDTYFRSADDDAPMIELQLNIRGCVEQDVDQWMRTQFGAPFEQKATRAYWKNSFLWAAALLPAEPGRCRIHFLPISEGGEIERLRQI